MSDLKEMYTSKEEVESALELYNQGKEKEDKKYYIYQIDRFFNTPMYLVVDYEFYSIFQNMEREERRTLDNDSRCIIPSQKYGVKRCDANCDECPLGKVKRDGAPFSLDYLYTNSNGEEFTLEIEDNGPSIDEDLKEIANQLLDELNEEDRFIFVGYYYDDMSDQEIADKLHKKRRTITDRRHAITNDLQEKSKKFL